MAWLDLATEHQTSRELQLTLFADNDTVQLVNAIGVIFTGLAGTVGAALIAYYGYKIRIKQMEIDANLQQAAKLAQQSAKAAAVNAAEVKNDLVQHTSETAARLDDLADKAEASQKTGDAIHALVNNKMGEQLQLTALALRQVANLTRNSADGAKNASAASHAEKLLQEHNDKQSVVDGMTAKDEK